MEVDKLFKDWEDLLCLVLEESEDDSYKKIELTLEKYREQTNNMIERYKDGYFDFNVMIAFYISLVMFESTGMEKLKDLDEYEVAERLDDFWVRYLKKPARSFVAKHGLSPINANVDTLGVSFRVIKREL